MKHKETSQQKQQQHFFKHFFLTLDEFFSMGSTAFLLKRHRWVKLRVALQLQALPSYQCAASSMTPHRALYPAVARLSSYHTSPAPGYIILQALPGTIHPVHSPSSSERRRSISCCCWTRRWLSSVLCCFSSSCCCWDRACCSLRWCSCCSCCVSWSWRDCSSVSLISRSCRAASWTSRMWRWCSRVSSSRSS